MPADAGITTATKDSRLIDDLGLDSFLIVYFLSEIDDQFHISLDETEFESFVTIGDVLERIKTFPNIC